MVGCCWEAGSGMANVELRRMYKKYLQVLGIGE